jgi:hypothetical protein
VALRTLPMTSLARFSRAGYRGFPTASADIEAVGVDWSLSSRTGNKLLKDFVRPKAETKATKNEEEAVFLLPPEVFQSCSVHNF